MREEEKESNVVHKRKRYDEYTPPGFPLIFDAYSEDLEELERAGVGIHGQGYPNMSEPSHQSRSEFDAIVEFVSADDQPRSRPDTEV